MKVHVEITEGGKGNRIDVFFPYDREAVAKVKQIPGSSFVAGEKLWRVPRDMETCRMLRDLFGEALVIGDDLEAWASEQVHLEKTLGKLASGGTARLKRLPQVLPDLYKAIHLGPKGRFMTKAERVKAMRGPASYQAADVAFIAGSPGPLNANQPGTGKTLEMIGGVYEGSVETGPKLVIAPIGALITVWQRELRRWQDQPVLIAHGSKNARLNVMEEAATWLDLGEPFWLVVNPDMVRFRYTTKLCESCEARKRWASEMEIKWKPMRGCVECERVETTTYPLLHDTQWNVIIIDECHKSGTRNTKTDTAQSMYRLPLAVGGKRIAASGTPMKGKAIDLFGTLHWLDPKTYSAKWTWARQYCEITDNGYGKVIGDLREEAKPRLYRSLQPILLRRTKEEVLPWLPPKVFVGADPEDKADRGAVWCYMDAAQQKQYDEMHMNAMVTLGEERMSATSILTEFLRLKQFSNALHKLRDGKLVPTMISGKVDALMERLEERGIFDKWQGPESEKVVIFSQFTEMVEMVVKALEAKGVDVVCITGQQHRKRHSVASQDAFQAEGGPRVMVMNTHAGGVSITLDRADSVHFLDEPWSPADLEQAEDRCHRGSRIHNVTVYTYLTAGTVDNYVRATVTDKAGFHREILDARRRMLGGK